MEKKIIINRKGLKKLAHVLSLITWVIMGIITLCIIVFMVYYSNHIDFPVIVLLLLGLVVVPGFVPRVLFFFIDKLVFRKKETFSFSSLILVIPLFIVLLLCLFRSDIHYYRAIRESKKYLGNETFVIEKWNSDKLNRGTMVSDFLRKYKKKFKTMTKENFINTFEGSYSITENSLSYSFNMVKGRMYSLSFKYDNNGNYEGITLSFDTLWPSFGDYE